MKKFKNIVLYIIVLTPFLGFSQGNTCATADTIFPETGGCTSPGYSNNGLTSVGDPTPSCWSDTPDNSAWFVFVATAAQVTVNSNFTTTGASITDTELALFSGTCGSLTEVNCNEDIGPGNAMAGLTQYGLTIGNTYYVMLDGAGGETGNFNVCIENLADPAPPEPGKDCSDGTALCDMSPTTFSTLAAGFGASDETGGTCLTFGEHQSTMVTFTAATSGDLEFIIQPLGNSEYDWVLFDVSGGCPIGNTDDVDCNYGYTGSSGSATGMGPVPGGADAGEFNAAYPVIAGNTYTLLISNFDDDNLGFDLAWGGTTTFEGPIAGFSGTPLTGCAPLDVNFTNTSTPLAGDTLVYSWDFGDGSPVTSTENPSYIFTTGGSYVVTLTAQGSGACVVRDTITIDIVSPAASFTPTVVCNGTTTDYANTSINSTTYEWDFTSDGSIDNTLTNPSFLFPNGGTYSTTLIATDGVTGCKDTVVTPVSVSAPLFSITPSTPIICSGDTVNLNALITPSPSTYAVTFSSTSTPLAIPDATKSGPSIIPGTLSNTITVTGVDPATISAGTIASVCFTIDHTKHSDITNVTLQNGTGTTIAFSPLPLNGNGVGTYCFTSADLSAFIGEDPNQIWTLFLEDSKERVKGQFYSGDLDSWSIIMNTSNFITSYGWQTITNIIDPDSLDPLAFPTTPTYYTIGATDATGCAGSDSVLIDVSAPDDASFSLTDFCFGAANQATGIATSGGTFRFSPSLGDGSSISSSDGSITDGVAGTTYTVEYITSGVSCKDSGTNTVTVALRDNPAFALADYCLGDVNQATSIITAGGAFSLSPSDGSSIDGSGTITDAVGGTTYTVQYATNGTCPDTTTNTITANSVDDASFDYGATTFCITGSDPDTISVGTSGGVFSGTNSLSINSSTGTIDLTASTTNNFVVTYRTVGVCPDTNDLPIVITASPDATVSYAGPYCPAGNTSVVFGSGAGGGLFTSTGGLSINSTTGEIDLSASTPGPYIVTNSITGIPGCADAIDTAGVTVRSLPVVSADASSLTICIGDSSELTGSGASSYTWDNSVSDGDFVSPVSNTTYTVTGIDANGCENTDQVTINTTPIEDGTFAFSSNTFCITGTNPDTISVGTSGGTFTATGSGIVDVNSGTINLNSSGVSNFDISYTTSGTCPNTTIQSFSITDSLKAEFSYGGPYCRAGSASITLGTGSSSGAFSSSGSISINTNTGEINLSGTSSGTYIINNNVAATGGCAATFDTASITVLASDDALFSVSNAFCEGTPNAAFNITTSGGMFSFNPAPLDGASINTVTGEITNEVGGTQYTIQYITTGVCPDTSTRNVNVFSSDDASFDFNSYCAGSSNGAINIIVVDGEFSFNPDPLDGSSINDATGEITGGMADSTYFVQYATNGTCPDTTVEQVTVLSLANAGFDFEGYCEGYTNIPDSIITIGGMFSFAPDQNDGSSIIDSTGEIFNGIAGTTYSVEYSVGSGDCSNKDTIDVYVDGVEAVFVASPTSGLAPLDVQFTNGSLMAGSYFWNFGTGDTSNVFDPTYTFNDEGSYTVKLYAYSMVSGCVDSMEFTPIVVEVDNSCEMSIPTAFTPGGDDDINNTWEIICMDNEEDATVVVFNRWGGKVYESEGGANYTSWDGKGLSGKELPSASYFYVVEVGNEKQTGTVTLIR